MTDTRSSTLEFDAAGPAVAPFLPQQTPYAVNSREFPVHGTWGTIFRRRLAFYRDLPSSERARFGVAVATSHLMLGQLAEALIRLVRVVVGIRLHTEDLSVEQGVRLFKEEAFLEDGSARREAERGTFDPSYVVYSLGKLMLLKLRDDVMREQGDRFTLRGFHDALMGHGLAPLWLHRALLLGEPAEKLSPTADTGSSICWYSLQTSTVLLEAHSDQPKWSSARPKTLYLRTSGEPSGILAITTSAGNDFKLSEVPQDRFPPSL